jgi:HD superfamily phosphodiesterase
MKRKKKARAAGGVYAAKAAKLLNGEGLPARLWRAALPFLNTRHNEIHTRIALGLALHLLDREGGDAPLVLAAVILHDVGWKRVPAELQAQAFGPHATDPALNRVHEVEGVRIAGKLLEEVWPDSLFREEILAIIDGHDSRGEPLSLNDRLVKDADKLWRYTRQGLAIDTARFGETVPAGLARLGENLPRWFLTVTGRRIAASLLAHRRREAPA